MPRYIPEKGDFVILTFDPQAGHEQRGRRPALVVSNTLSPMKNTGFRCMPKQAAKPSARTSRTRYYGDSGIIAAELDALLSHAQY